MAAEKIKFVVEVDSKGAITSMKKLESSGKQATDGMKKGFLTLNNVVKGTVIGAIAAVVFQMKSLITSTLEYGDKLNKLSIRLGVSVKSLDKLKHIAELSGTSLDAVSRSFIAMTRNIDMASTGLGEAAKAFDELGISVDDLLKLDPEEQFLQIVEALAKIENPTKRNAVGMRILGRTFIETVPMIEDLRAKMDETSTAFSKDGTDAIAKFNDNMAELGRDTRNTFIPFIEELAKAFNKLYDAMNGKDSDTTPQDLMIAKLKQLARWEAKYNELKENGWPDSKLKNYTDKIEALKAEIIEMQAHMNARNAIQPTSSDGISVDPVIGNKGANPNLQGKGIGAGQDAVSAKVDEINRMEQLEEQARADAKAAHQQGIIDKYIAEVEAEEKLRQTKNDAWEWERNFQAKIDEEQVRKEAEKAAKMKAIEEDLKMSFADGLTQALFDFADGTKSAGDAFREFASDFLRLIAQMIIKQQILNALGSSGADGGEASGILGSIGSGTMSTFLGMMMSAKGNVFSGGRALAFANGGVVGGPTVFPMANGVGIMGEAGPEAIMPLKRGSDGKLGVAGGGGNSVNIVNNINIENGGSLSDPAEAQKVFGEMSDMMKEQVRMVIKDESRVGGMLNTSIDRRVI